jgi:serine/threonine protein kinase
MKVLSIRKAKSSLLHPAFDNIETFELDDKPFDSGAFGAVYFCHSANGKPLPVPQVVKILIDDGTGSARQGIRTIQNLQDKIIQHNTDRKQKGLKAIEDINCLFALPQLSYEGYFDSKIVYGYSQNRLNTQEFTIFKDFFDEPDSRKRRILREQFNSSTIHQRLQLAYNLSEGFEILREMAYIHADLNPKNLFIRLNPPALTLIDYDSGVVVNNPNDQADTFGQLGGWIAPEIQQQLFRNQGSNIRVDLNTDTWSVAIAIHYLLFLFHPLDFLKVRGEKSMKDYFAKKRWYDFDTNDPNFRTELKPVYEKYQQFLPDKIPPAILRALDVTINEGYFNPARRVTYKQWQKVIAESISGIVVYPVITNPAVNYITTNTATLSSARIVSFSADNLRIESGNIVRVFWEVEDAVNIRLDGRPMNQNLRSGTFSKIIKKDTPFVLSVTGNDGKTISEKIIIRAVDPFIDNTPYQANYGGGYQTTSSQPPINSNPSTIDWYKIIRYGRTAGVIIVLFSVFRSFLAENIFSNQHSSSSELFLTESQKSKQWNIFLKLKTVRDKYAEKISKQELGVSPGERQQFYIKQLESFQKQEYTDVKTKLAVIKTLNLLEQIAAIDVKIGINPSEKDASEKESKLFTELQNHLEKVINENPVNIENLKEIVPSYYWRIKLREVEMKIQANTEVVP